MNDVELLQRYRLGERDFRGARLAYSCLYEAELAGADLRGALLVDTRLEDADFSRADLTDADLLDADLTGAIMPDGTRYEKLREAWDANTR